MAADEAAAAAFLAALRGALVQAAPHWLDAVGEAPAPGRPSALLPGLDEADVTLWRSPKPDPPREWRVYVARRLGPRAPFVLRGALALELEAGAFTRESYRLILGREPDPATRASPLPDAASREALLRRLATSAEARGRHERFLLVLATRP